MQGKLSGDVAAPCPIDGPIYEPRCPWCVAATFRGVRVTVRDLIYRHIRPDDPAGVIEDLTLVGSVDTALVADAEIGTATTGPDRRRFPVRPDGAVLELVP
jgi:hypothetical protein